MITSALIYVVGAVLLIGITLLALLSPASGIVYPPGILAAFTLFGNSLASVNFFFDTYTLAQAVIAFMQFLIYYFSAFLILDLIKRARGG
jgi:hypothetical protein